MPLSHRPPRPYVRPMRTLDSVDLPSVMPSGSGGDAPAAPAKGCYLNPVIDADFPDPAVIRAPDGFYYAYATQTKVGDKWINIQLARSSDLVTWRQLGDALPAKPNWASKTQDFWAPHVTRRGDTYYMYYS